MSLSAPNEKSGKSGDFAAAGQVRVEPPSDDSAYLQLQIASARYEGPMPPPELLRAYAEISPDLPLRMMAMAEKAQEHEQQLDAQQLAAAREDMAHNWRVVRRGQVCGLSIAVCSLLAGVGSLAVAPNAAGAIMGTIVGGGGVAALIWAFRYDRHHSQTKASTMHVAPPSVQPWSTQEQPSNQEASSKQK